jgi:hypothetical protein
MEYAPVGTKIKLEEKDPALLKEIYEKPSYAQSIYG